VTHAQDYGQPDGTYREDETYPTIESVKKEFSIKT